MKMDSNTNVGQPELEAGSNTWAPQQTDGQRAAHVMVAVLKAAGVDRIYGQSCPTALFLAAEKVGIQQYGYRTENAGVAIADGAARISRRISVVTAQNGPAAALLVAGLLEALKASVPVLAIVQEVPLATADRNAFQEVDHEKIFSGCTKWIRRIHLADRAGEYVQKAILAATSGRPGPVVLLVSPDVLIEPVAQTFSLEKLDQEFGRFPLDRFVSSADKLDQLFSLLVKAERPLIVAGGGVHLSDATAELSQLQQLFKVPVATTNMGKGAIDESHPLSIGVIGNAMGTGSPAKFFYDYIQSADIIVFIGSRTNENGTAGWSLFPASAQYVQIDVDPVELSRNYQGLRVLGDARETIRELCARAANLEQDSLNTRFARILPLLDAARNSHKRESLALAARKTPLIRPDQIMRLLDKSRTETVWVADASYSSIWLVQYIRSTRPGTRFITPRGIAGLGWGVPMAIGAKLAEAGTRVVCLTGDGGFAHCWAELESAKRHGVAITIIVLNNGVLGFQINAEQSRFSTHTEICHFGPIDHVAIAKACGCDGQHVSTLEELGNALEAAECSSSPYVIDVQVDPKAFPPLTAFESQLPAITAAPDLSQT